MGGGCVMVSLSTTVMPILLAEMGHLKLACRKKG